MTNSCSGVRSSSKISSSVVAVIISTCGVSKASRRWLSLAVARAALTDVPPDDDEEEVLPELLLLKVVGKMTVSQKLSLLPVSTTRGGITWSRPIIPIRKKAEKVAMCDETFARKMMTYVVFELAALRIHDCMVWRKGAITLLLIFACPIKLLHKNEEYFEMRYIRTYFC